MKIDLSPKLEWFYNLVYRIWDTVPSIQVQVSSDYEGINANDDNIKEVAHLYQSNAHIMKYQ